MKIGKKKARRDNRKEDKKKKAIKPVDVAIEPSFTKDILKYPNPGKLKPLAINPYDHTQDPIGHV